MWTLLGGHAPIWTNLVFYHIDFPTHIRIAHLSKKIKIFMHEKSEPDNGSKGTASNTTYVQKKV